MTENEREAMLLALDDELLKGDVILSEWCTFITRDADTSFIHGAFLACILTSVAAIETHLRSESGEAKRMRLAQLIDAAQLESDLTADLHGLRRYRNRWVHVEDPWEDSELLEHPEQHEAELEQKALMCVRALRRTIYNNPGV
jgi:hypothetical protein